MGVQQTHLLISENLMNNQNGNDGIQTENEDLNGVFRSLLLQIDGDTPLEQAGEAVLDQLALDPEKGGECLAWLIAYDLDPLVANMAFTSAFMALKGGGLDDEIVSLYVRVATLSLPGSRRVCRRHDEPGHSN